MDNNNKNTANNNNNTVVLDRSALLALFYDEEGANVIYRLLPNAVISTVTLCEIIILAVESGISANLIFEQIEALELHVEAFNSEQAKLAAQLTAQYENLSLSERAGIALALSLNLPLYTADLNLNAQPQFI